MSITLSDGTTTLTLPRNLDWTNEYPWDPVVQESGYSVGGALIIELATKLSGRQIALKSPPDMAVLTRAQLDVLKTWRDIAGQVMTLTLRGLPHSVVFDHATGAIEAEPLVPLCDNPPPDAWYFVTLNFLEI